MRGAGRSPAAAPAGAVELLETPAAGGSADRGVPPYVEMLRILHAPTVTQCVVVAAELGVPDLVADGPCTADELAAQVDADPHALYRVLRALADAGVFREIAPRTFGSTPLSDTLRAGTELSLRDWARLWGLPQRQVALGALMYSVRTGQPAFPYTTGTGWWSHMAAHPDQAAVFNAAAGDMARRLNAAAVGTYDLSDVRRLVDVGGGEGHLAARILRRHPDMTAVLFDQPDVVPSAQRVLAEAGVADRVQLRGGDFFTSVPEGGDAYLLSMVLHDWNDAQATTILANVRRAMDPDGRVLVIDAVLPADDTPHDGKLRDVIMLALHGGRERTEADFAAMFERAGLRHKETRAASASTGLLVAIAAAPPDGRTG